MTDISVATGPWESTDVARHCAAIKTMFDRATDWQADLMLSLVNELFDHMAQNLPQNDEAPAPKGGQGG